MGNFKITKLNWSEAKGAIKSVNEKLYNLLNPVATQLNKKKRDFVYSLKLKFGEVFIKNSKFLALQKDAEGNFPITFIDSDSIPIDITLQEKFLLEFTGSIGEIVSIPLSLITKNYVEICGSSISPYYISASEKYQHDYHFPFSLLNEGDLFGVWDAIQVIIEDNEYLFDTRTIVGGRKCLVTTLPEKNSDSTSREYKAAYNRIFGPNETILDSITSSVNSKLKANTGSDFFTEVFLIPHEYYASNDNDSSEIHRLKSIIQKFIFKTGWKQEENFRLPTEIDRSLFKNNKVDGGLIFNLQQHLLNISKSKTYGLKPIDESDGILFEVLKDITQKLRDENLLKNYFPLLFQYSKLEEADWLIEMSLQPSFNTILPPYKFEAYRMAIVTGIQEDEGFMNQINIPIKFYTNQNNDPHLTIKSFIKNKIAPIYVGSLIEENEIINPKSAWFFNGLFFIENKI